MKTQTRFIVPSIHCEGCKNTIENLLTKHDYLQNLAVDIEQKTVQFSHPTTLDPDSIKGELTNIFGEVYTIDE